jgi:hypothetical protein
MGGGRSKSGLPSRLAPFPVAGGPRWVGAGAPAFTMRVSGWGFVPTSVVRWNGSNRPTTFYSGTFLTAEIPASDVALPGSAQVTVYDPPPGGGTSEPWTISIVTPPPNDSFASATLIPAYPFNLTQTAMGATLESLDPKPLPCMSQPADPQETVWFQFTPPGAGAALTVATNTSNYGNVVSAWAGSPGTLTNFGCWYVGGGQYDFGPMRALTTSTSPVHIMVSSLYMGTASTLNLSLDVKPGFTMAASPASQTVKRGSSATYTLTLTPHFGSFDEEIWFECDMPAGVTCSFSPQRVTPGSAAASVTLTVGTGGTARLQGPAGGAPMIAFFTGLPVFAFLLTPRILRGGRKRKASIFFGLLMIAAFLGMLAACGGGGGNTGGGGNGGGGTGYTYTITVWAYPVT